ncbi:MAG: DUF2961 domain-containing protein [Tannerellaceae bacterium]|jgi:hypothetical protein|nr:DUF2961 domain-containing protein [Tannerellaceae bacterium]
MCRYFAAMVAVVVCGGLFSSCLKEEKNLVSLSALLDEMLSVEESARYPAIPYRTLALSGRAENVLFDKRGPGVITRIRLASEDKRGVVRFYFDGASSAEISLPSYDFSQLGMPEAAGGLLTAGGSVLYLPLPYDKSCKITFEEESGDPPAPKFYQINYRQYPEGTQVETFSLQKITRIKRKITEVNHLLLNPDSVWKTTHVIRGEAMLEEGNPIVIKLPKGEQAVYGLHVQVTPAEKEEKDYPQLMRNIILQGIFDGKRSVRAPVSDFSGGGMGGAYVESRWLSADGQGSLISRWLMPYREKASIAFANEGRKNVHIRYAVYVSPLAWDERMLYFHASWKEETGLSLSNTEGKNWEFAAIGRGRGVYKGDVLSLYNHTTAWYGEGSARISVDSDEPSCTENGTGDYYNNLSLPVTPFQTPWGGAPRADLKSSYGYNTFVRTRILDDIPFTERFRFELELRGQKAGNVDYASTVFWYGDRKARPENISRPEVWARTLLPSPTVESAATVN